MPSWFFSRSSMTADSVAPSAWTARSPPVWGRRIVGMRTSTAMSGFTFGFGDWIGSGVAAVIGVTVDDANFFLGDLTVDDPVGAELHLAGLVGAVAGGHQDVVRAGLGGEIHVGARRIGLGRRVRVVDDDRFLVVVVHLAVELAQ